MVIGPLSEWVAAVAEILAVCVALFLPYYTAHRASKSRQKKFRLAIARLSEEALNGNQVSKKELPSFLDVGFLISDNEQEQNIITIGRQIQSLLNLPLTNDRQTEIKRLIKQLR